MSVRTRRLRRWRTKRTYRGRQLATPRPAARPATIEPLGPATRTSDASERTGSRLRLRASFAALLIVSLLALLLVRLWSIQVIEGPKLLQSALATTTRDVVVAPPRGDILARDGQVLAGDVLREVVTLDQKQAALHPEVVGRLAALLSVSAASIRTELHDAALGLGQYSPYAPVPILGSGALSSTEILAITSNPTEFPGVSITPTYERIYPQQSLASQMLGYVGDINASELARYKSDGYTAQDSFGQSGLEAQYELYLHGKPGIARVEVDPSGQVVTKESTSPPRQGDTLTLNLDLGLEETLDSALVAQIVKLRSGAVAQTAVPADWGAAVVLDPRTGAVLAMSSFPSYNNNEWVGGISARNYNTLLHAPGSPLNDYAIAGLQAPGSTFKLATATAALDDGLISPSTYYTDTGSYVIPGSNPPVVLHNAGGEVLGTVNVTSALAESSDVFFYNLGAEFWYGWANGGRFPETAIQDYAGRYGFGERTHVDLPGELGGQVDSPILRKQLHAQDPAGYPYTGYYPADNVEMAFGQGETLVTPLQMADAYATFANGGTRYAPQIAAELTSSSNHTIERFRPRVLARVRYVPGAYQAMLAGFEGAVQNAKGTAYGAFTGFDFSRWNIAGKTGTATATANPNQQPTSWFVAFGGPRGHTPRYVVAVEIDQAGYGADAAAPVARQVFNYLYRHPVQAVGTKGA